jgi:D-glycero-alpha-D-manno-heptose-7-phosphate kinase
MIGRVARASAPVRIADVGGWTDTWFGSPGQVCHVAMGPGVTVEARPVPGPAGRVRVVAPDVGLEAVVDPLAPGGAHPLLAHAIAEAWEQLHLAASPPVPAVELDVRSAVPPGASLGTSAAVVVAILGALHGLLAVEPLAPEAAAVAAHEVETVRAGRHSGVQDQWAAAMGGAGLLTIAPYPQVRHRVVPIPAAVGRELEDRTVTVCFGPHDSSAVHAQVINDVVGCAGEAHDRARRTLRTLAALAGDAASALEAGDLDRWAEVLTAATDAQRALHPALVGPRHQAAIDAAHRLGAAGWKVNGAGGAGGSVSIVLGAGRAAGSRHDLVDALWRLDPSWTVLDLAFAPTPGLRVERA